MAAFDAQVRQVGEYIARLRAAGRPVLELACPRTLEELSSGLPIHVGPGANQRIILRSDTFVELGSPDVGSCAFVLWTDAPSLLRDGIVTLIGPDISGAAGASLPFGQVVLVAGAGLGPEQHPVLDQTQYVADQVEGYMVRSSSRSMWSRVSRDAAAKGFSFEALGRSLMILFRSSVPEVEAVEVVFITSTRQDVLGLEEIARCVRETGREIVREHWKERGFDLDCDFDCRACGDRQVCDDIRAVIGARRRDADSPPAVRSREPGSEDHC